VNILVVYDSKFGNTEHVAQVVAERLHRLGPTELTTADKAPQAMPDALDLLVVGGPTQGHGASPSLRSWLQGLEKVQGVRAAAFDTRFAKPRWLTGSAAVVTARQLRRTGFRMLRDPESFLVAHTEGPLLDGEIDRAAAWADTLANQLITEAVTRGHPDSLDAHQGGSPATGPTPQPIGRQGGRAQGLHDGTLDRG
jgi:flavodoxin